MCKYNHFLVTCVYYPTKKTSAAMLRLTFTLLLGVGRGGLEPPNPKERIYSPPQLPLCDLPVKRFGIAKVILFFEPANYLPIFQPQPFFMSIYEPFWWWEKNKKPHHRCGDVALVRT